MYWHQWSEDRGLGSALFRSRQQRSASVPFGPRHIHAVLRQYEYRSKPLQIWDKKVRNGHIKRITDQDIQSSVLEIVGTNVSTTFITCPADASKTLGIKLPFLVMILKNLKKYFTFEVQVLDDKNVRRRFRASNYQSTTRVKPFICTMPMRLDEVGATYSTWNHLLRSQLSQRARLVGTSLASQSSRFETASLHYLPDLSCWYLFSPFLLALSVFSSFFLLSFRVRVCTPSTAPRVSPAPSWVSAGAGG